MLGLNRTVVLTMSFAIAHQIDAAYWREWEMFGIPGGVQVYDLVNIALFIALIGAVIPVFQRRRRGFACSLAIAALAASILPIHAGFFLAGYRQFDLPVSIAIIIASFAAAVAQAWMTLRARAEFVGD